MYLLVPVALGDVMGDERMEFTSSHRRHQGKTVLQPVGDSEDAHGLESRVGIMRRRGTFEHLRGWIEGILA
jgi:hypothetical protein